MSLSILVLLAAVWLMLFLSRRGGRGRSGRRRPGPGGLSPDFDFRLYKRIEPK